ncbi:MAG: TolC family protein [Acidobacteriaceae bacterium]
MHEMKKRQPTQKRTNLNSWAAMCAALYLSLALPLGAQQTPPAAMGVAAAAPATATLSSPQAVTPPVAITLAEAQQRALKIEPTLLAAKVARGTAAYDRALARSALLPQAVYHAEFLYTEPNGVPDSGPLPGTVGPVFIANNSVNEYISQAHVTEKLSLANAARYRQTSALALQAKAQAEIAVRGLHAVVTQAYYAVQSATRKFQAAQQAEQEAQNFVDLTRKLEAGREVAHADVIKAELLLAQRQRDLEDARLAEMETRQSLGVLLFPDPATPYVLVDPLNGGIDIPDESEVHSLASQSNPELGSALAALQAANADVLASRAGYVPAFTFGYDFGIDAPYLATSGSGGRQFLGYAAYGAMDVPMWNWFATHDRVKQSELRQHQARAALSYTQRQLIATLNADYGELRTARDALASLNGSVGQARDSLRLTTLRYQSGEASVLEVVDAQNTYLATEAMAADGAVRYHVARANLERLTGKLP